MVAGTFSFSWRASVAQRPDLRQMRPVSRRSRPSWPRSASCGSRQARTTCALDANERKKIARNWRLLDDGTRLLLRDACPGSTSAPHVVAVLQCDDAKPIVLQPVDPAVAD